MSTQVSVCSSLVRLQALDTKRPMAEYLPTIWGDHFLCFASSTKTTSGSVQEEHERMKVEVRRELMNDTSDSSEKLRLIDEIQRLGVAYHFEKEIEYALSQQMIHALSNKDDLYTVAVRFRLLRQRGINVSPDALEQFKDSERKFKESLNDDVEGMLSLFEASHVGVRGEEILDEALAFTTTKLKATLAHLSPHIAEEVSHALKWPIHHAVPRMEARYHIDLYSKDESKKNKSILRFAKLDFNIVQEHHQKELCAMTEWWRSLNVKTKLPFARDRIVECYFWMSAVYFEPKYSLGRMILTKITAMLSLLDDAYDNYGTIEELKLLTETIQRWDIKAIDELPAEYLKMLYCTLLDVYTEIEKEVAKEETSYCIDYAKQAMKDDVQSYFDEAKWRELGHVPNMEEYMQVSLISAGLRMLGTASFMGMGTIATKETYEWILSTPKMIRALSVIGRLNDDIVSHKFEQERKHIGSAVECCMAEYRVSEEDAVKMLKIDVVNAWKDFNEEFMKLISEIPKPLLERLLNLARSMDTVYKDGDGFTDNHLVKDHITSLFLEPVLV